MQNLGEFLIFIPAAQSKFKHFRGMGCKWSSSGLSSKVSLDAKDESADSRKGLEIPV